MTAAALLCWMIRADGGRSLATRFTSLAPVGYVGRSSYGLYLFHQPQTPTTRLLAPGAPLA